MDITGIIKNAGIALEDCVIVGSGILSALNIRASNDIDIIVSDQTFAILKKQGWIESDWPDQKVLQKNNIEAGTIWDNKKFKQLKSSSAKINGAYYLSLEDLRKWKINKGRDKDLTDVKLIDGYLRKLNQ